MLTLYTRFIKPFFSGQARTVKAKKQIFYSFFQKGLSMVIGLLFVPLILNYLDAERYGIWLTLSSIIGWTSFFDFGLGNGLRNRLSEAIAKKDYVLARVYVSTTYGVLAIVFIMILILFSVINPFLNWQAILNTKSIDNPELITIAFIIFVFFILRFFFNLIGVILMANQRPSVNNSFNLIANILTLATIFILTKTTSGSLIVLATILSATPVLILVCATFLFFFRDYRAYSPSIRFFDLSKAKSLLGLGFSFFYIQIAAVIFFSTTNFLIAQVSDPQLVTAYNISYKYFFTISMVFSIVLSPIWSAVTEAYSREDYLWLKRCLKKLNILSLFMILAVLLLLLLSPFAYKLWVGDKIEIPHALNIMIAFYLIQQLIIAPYSQFINGFGKLRLGIFVLTLKIVIFIPSAYFLGKSQGAFGIVLAMGLIQLPSLFIEPIQVYKLINKRAHGIWNK